MAKNKLSEALLDAYMANDFQKVAEIREQLEKEAKLSEPRKKETVYKINTPLTNGNSTTEQIYNWLNKNLGEDWWEDEIETLDRILWLDYGIVLDGTERDRVLAIRHICNSDAPFYDWYEFNQVALALGDTGADFTYLRIPTPGMIINAVHALNLIRPDEKDDFNDDVKNYICISLINDGIYTPPPSIAHLIAKNMKELTKEWQVKHWPSVEKKMREVLSKKDFNEDDPAEIQAKRLIVAEGAASKY